MLGDSAICVGFGFHSRHPGDASPAFARVGPILRRGSVVFGNLETLLSRSGRGRTRRRRDQMRGDPAYARSLRDAGFTALGVANNHAMQHGIDAFNETVESLKAADIACVGLRGSDGWCAEPAIQRTREGFRVGLLGYCWRPRQYEYGTPPFAEGNIEAVENDVRRLAAMVDAVVVSLHWGEEFLTGPSASEVAAAHRIIDAGAAVLVGHHPHVLRPGERYGRGVICYSLGNFVTDMLWQPALRVGGVLECQLDNGGALEATIWRVRVDDHCTPIPEASNAQLKASAVEGMPDPAYAVAANSSVRLQQRATYAYALRNFFRYPAPVLTDLIATTIGNKLSSVLSAVTDRPMRRGS